MFEKELEKNNQERKAIKDSLITAQIAFANTIKNGMGDDIKRSLKAPEKPKKYKIVFFKFKEIFNKIIKIC